jgi:hypothetical protein
MQVAWVIPDFIGVSPPCRMCNQRSERHAAALCIRADLAPDYDLFVQTLTSPR